MQLPWKWYSLSLLVIVLDHIAKWVASSELTYGVPVEVLPVFNWMLAHNSGAAFSFLSDAGGWQRWLFTVIATGVSIVLAVWLARARGQTLLCWALALVLGGALGNLIDRVLFGYVVDFISLHYGGYYFPAFNLADSAITVGAGLLILDMFLNPGNHASEKPAATKSGKTP
jgi:signal peptidase II